MTELDALTVVAARPTAELDMEGVLARAQVRTRRHRRQQRAGLAGALVVLAAIVLTVLVPNPQPLVATPQPLISTDDPGQPAASVLEMLAGQIEGRVLFPEPTVEMVAWYMNVSVADEVRTEIVPVYSRTEYQPDDTATVFRRRGDPVSPQDTQVPPSITEGPTTEQTYDPGARQSLGPLPPAATRDELAEIIGGDPSTPFAIRLHTAVGDRIRAATATGDDLARLYRTWAASGQARDYGPSSDRLGRPVRIVGLESEATGLPTRTLLMIHPDTGVLLGHEEILTRDPGALPVTIPAVTTYEIYRYP